MNNKNLINILREWYTPVLLLTVLSFVLMSCSSAVRFGESSPNIRFVKSLTSASKLISAKLPKDWLQVTDSSTEELVLVDNNYKTTIKVTRLNLEDEVAGNGYKSALELSKSLNNFFYKSEVTSEETLYHDEKTQGYKLFLQNNKVVYAAVVEVKTGYYEVKMLADNSVEPQPGYEETFYSFLNTIKAN